MNREWIDFLPDVVRIRLKTRPNLLAVLENTGWIFMDYVLRMVVGLFVTVWVARYLGVGGYGTLNFAAAYAGLFGALASLGLDAIVVRNMVLDSEKVERILASAFALKLVGGTVAFALSFTTAHLVRPNDLQTVYLVGIVAACMIFQSFDAINLWFQAQTRSKYAVLARSGAFLVVTSLKIFLILCNAPLIAFGWTLLAESFFTALGLLVFFLRRKHFLDLLRASIGTMKNLLRESWPLALSSIAIFIYMRVDQVMLAQMIDDEEVGLYAAALRFSEIWYFVPAAIITSVAPSLTQIRSSSMEAYMVRMQQVFDWLVRIAFCIAILMTFIAPYLIAGLYGSSYGGAAPILSIHIWTAVFVFMGVGSNPWIVNEGMMRYSLFQTVAGACINIGLNYFFFIPRYGALGAAAATLISQCFAAFLFNGLVPKLRPLFVFQAKSLMNPFRGLL